jgi:PPOX class probable F420-dependent enzyme
VRAKPSSRRPPIDAGGPVTPSLNADEILKRVARSRVAHLATVSSDGRPDLVPITFALVDSILYTGVDHKPKRSRDLVRLANIGRDPRVTVLVDHYDENWSKLWWCRLRGEASVVAEGADFQRGVEALTEKYEPYQRTRLRGPLIVVRVTSTLGWSALG